MAHVFVSYKREDRAFVEELTRRLSHAGIAVWNDTSIQFGENWDVEIDAGIKDSFALVVLMTSSARLSEYITYEWAVASGLGIPVVPVLLEKTALHPKLQKIQYVDFTVRYAEPWVALVERLTHLQRTSRKSPKLLFLASQPLNLPHLNLGEEARAISEGLRLAFRQNAIVFIQEWAVRVDEFDGLLRRHQPDLMHLSGHGDAEQLLLFVDNQGHANALSRELVTDIISQLKNKLKCAVLLWGDSDTLARDIVQYIDNVIGISGQISDASAIRFSKGFYRSLGEGDDVRIAFEAGRNAVRVSKPADYEKLTLHSKDYKSDQVVFVRF